LHALVERSIAATITSIDLCMNTPSRSKNLVQKTRRQKCAKWRDSYQGLKNRLPDPPT
jgi:hypothetical protein